MIRKNYKRLVSFLLVATMVAGITTGLGGKTHAYAAGLANTEVSDIEVANAEAPDLEETMVLDDISGDRLNGNYTCVSKLYTSQAYDGIVSIYFKLKIHKEYSCYDFLSYCLLGMLPQIYMDIKDKLCVSHP